MAQTAARNSQLSAVTSIGLMEIARAMAVPRNSTFTTTGHTWREVPPQCSWSSLWTMSSSGCGSVDVTTRGLQWKGDVGDRPGASGRAGASVAGSAEVWVGPAPGECPAEVPCTHRGSDPGSGGQPPEEAAIASLMVLPASCMVLVGS